MWPKFHMEKYYDDLGNVQDKLNRIKSEKCTRQKREDSRSNLFGGQSAIPCMPHKAGTISRHLVIDKPYRPPSKENDGSGRANNTRIRIDSKHDRDPTFMDTNTSTVLKKPTDLNTIESTKIQDIEYTRLKAERDRPERKTAEADVQSYSGLDRTRKSSMLLRQNHHVPAKLTEEEQIFVRETNSLYHVNYLTSQEPINQLVTQLRKRDNVYRVVQERFPNDNPSSYCRQLQQLIKRQETLTKIVQEFKKMSNIEITDLNELLYFIKNE